MNKQNCVFCEIISEHDERRFIYEDDLVYVIPTIRPVNTAHLMVIPKEHAVYMNELDDETAAHIMKIAGRTAEAIRKSKYKCEGINLFLADGEAAGQEVFHFHLHVFPRFKDDGWGFKWDGTKNLIRKEIRELDEVVIEIRKNF